VSSGGFKRSSRFGLVGVVIVAALAAAIGLTMGEGQANPKLAMGLIFGVIGVFVVVLLLLQRSDLERAAGGDAAARTRAAAKGGRRLDDPTAVGEAELWAALATWPIDTDAVGA
jgi:Flp pilus assembly protein protease CpaA